MRVVYDAFKTAIQHSTPVESAGIVVEQSNSDAQQRPVYIFASDIKSNIYTSATAHNH